MNTRIHTNVWLERVAAKRSFLPAENRTRSTYFHFHGSNRLAGDVAEIVAKNLPEQLIVWEFL